MSEDPAVFLKRPPSDQGKFLTEQAGQQAGAPVPFWMFAEVAVRQRGHSRWIDGIDGLVKKIRRHARAALGALAVNLLAIAGFALHQAWAAGAAEQRELQQAIDIGELRLDIRELRAELRRLSGSDMPRMDGNDDTSGDPEGKFSNLNRWGAVLASGISRPTPTPDSSCGRICSTSIECSSLVPSCKFCNFGECKATRPERIPIPVDAGVPDSGAPAGAQ